MSCSSSRFRDMGGEWTETILGGSKGKQQKIKRLKKSRSRLQKQPAHARLVEHGELSVPVLRTREENIKPMNNANDPWKGFPFLKMLRRHCLQLQKGIS